MSCWRDNLPSYDVTSFLQKSPDEWKALAPCMNRNNLIEVAFKSREFRDVIKTQKIGVESLCWELTNYPLIEVMFQKKQYFLLAIEGFKYTDTITSKKLSMIEMMEMMTNVLLEVLEVKNFQFIWYTRPMTGMKDLFIWDITRNFEKIKIMPSECSTVQEISSFLKFIMEDVTTEQLIVTMDRDDVRCRIPFKQNKISITSNIFPMECFTSMECKEVSLTMETWSWTEINTLIKFWIHGGLPNLEHLQVYNICKLGNREDFFTGITAIPAEPNTNQPVNLNERGFYIYRKTDRRMASITFNGLFFSFYKYDEDEEEEDDDDDDEVEEDEEEEEDDDEDMEEQGEDDNEETDED